MKIGIIYPQTELHGDPGAVRQLGLAAEELGYHHLLAFDHVVGAAPDRDPPLWGPYTDQHPFHDPFVMFSYLAGITEHIEFTTGVLILPQRQTVLVAKQATDLDLLSTGRLRLGVGTGWNPVEYHALGQDFHSRGKRLDEQILLLRQLWSQPLVDFSGTFDHVDRAALNPRPTRPIPIWLGGFADVAMRRAARVGDGFIFADGADGKTRAADQARRMKHLLEAEGRAPQSFGMDCMLSGKTPQDVVARIQRWQEAGGCHASILTSGRGFKTVDDHLSWMEQIASGLIQAGLPLNSA